jgi:hypothetical protein
VIRLKLNPNNCSGDFKKYSLVSSNDPQKAQFVLILEGRKKQ